MVPIKEKAALQYEKRFQQAVQNSPTLEPLPEKTSLYLEATIFYPDMRRDLDGELLPDLLQKSKLVKNDRYFRRKTYVGRIDKENPRVEFEIGVIDRVGVA